MMIYEDVTLYGSPPSALVSKRRARRRYHVTSAKGSFHDFEVEFLHGLYESVILLVLSEYRGADLQGGECNQDIVDQ